MEQEIAITGGLGFIGGSLVKHLAKKFKVKIVDIKPPPEHFSKVADFVCCDIRNYQEIADVVKNVDLVIHTAIVQIPLINENRRLAYDVNVIGTQNLCRVVDESPKIKGMILAGTWHTIGERDLTGVVDEEFGFRPDKVEERARLYAFSKVAQEAITRFYDEMSPKTYGIIRMGTVLGDGMPKETAANLFIEKGLRGDPLTPYKHSMYRPMLYVDIRDICNAYEIFATKILDGSMKKGANSLEHIVNVYFPQSMTILELAEAIQQSIAEQTNGSKRPKLEIVDKGLPPMFKKEDKNKLLVNIEKTKSLLGINKLLDPTESIRDIISQRLKR